MGLGKLGDCDAVEPLILAYKLEKPHIQEHIVVALDEIGCDEAVKFLKEIK